MLVATQSLAPFGESMPIHSPITPISMIYASQTIPTRVYRRLVSLSRIKETWELEKHGDRGLPATCSASAHWSRLQAMLHEEPYSRSSYMPVFDDVSWRGWSSQVVPPSRSSTGGWRLRGYGDVIVMSRSHVLWKRIGDDQVLWCDLAL